MKTGTKVRVRIEDEECIGEVQEVHWNEDTHLACYRIAVLEGSSMFVHRNKLGDLWVNLSEMTVI